MTNTDQLQEFLDDDGLLLPPIKSKAHPEGKRYFVESPDFETGILLQQLSSIAQRLASGIEVDPEEAARLKFDDGAEEQGFAQIVLGPTFDEMRQDGVRWGPLRNAVQYVFTWYAMSPVQAKKLVQSVPKARAVETVANRADRRKKKKR